MNSRNGVIEKPWNTPWPTSGLEYVEECPICKSQKRIVLHQKVVDNVFYCAPGVWTLWNCLNCDVAYLDPRPSEESIHLAYSTYYTHAERAEQKIQNQGVLFNIVRSIMNQYANWRYSKNIKASFTLGALLAHIIFPLKKIVDHKYRHLCKLPLSGGKLLDVGCGNGSFLHLARNCGWDVIGVDPDPKSVRNVLDQGLTAYEGGIDYFHGKRDLFDVITLSHVIEHVHDPIEVLKVAHTLLKPGGQLWLETPNIASFGHALFQENWRGIEAPRHLVVFSRLGLSKAFAAAGFEDLADRDRPSACLGMLKSSLLLKNNYLSRSSKNFSIWLKLYAFFAMIVESFYVSRREFLTVTVNKKIL